MSGPRYSIFAADAVFDERLTPFDVRVLAALGAHSDNRGWAIVRQTTLAQRLGSSAGGVQNSVRKLASLGYLNRRERYAESGAKVASLYQVVLDRGPDGNEQTTPLENGEAPHCVMGRPPIGEWGQKNDLFLERPSSSEDRTPSSPKGELMAVLDAERAEAVVQHRQRLRKPLTNYAAKLLARKLAKAPDPNQAADAMIASGWIGFEPEWLSRQSGKLDMSKRNSQVRPRDVVAAATARLKQLQSEGAMHAIEQQ